MRSSGSRSNRSTVGTSTEIADHLRLLFAKASQLFCYGCGKPVQQDMLYEYCLEKGPVRRQQASHDGIFLQGSSLLSLHRDELQAPQACREVKCLMRAALALYLGARPLRTREVLRQLSIMSHATQRDVTVN